MAKRIVVEDAHLKIQFKFARLHTGLKIRFELYRSSKVNCVLQQR